ncbi:unnamed protein product [Clonostachys chloroleuca]|uniref:Cytochrome P450 n=1 Tax=Clonostachys chloroleuca TaxID=1926264 RepID=A0AA35QEP9_9HYPO|nr:unnamed protein product [Clonostachys chloroleuca]
MFEALLQLTARPTTLWAIVLTGLVLLLHLLTTRKSFSHAVPKLWKPDDLPILGAWRFYTHREEMYRTAQRSTKTGNFSFFVGKKHVVGVSGPEGRRTFFDSKDLDLGEGFNDLFAGLPAQSGGDDFDRFLKKTLVTLLKSENLNKNIGMLATDARRVCEALAAAPVSDSQPEWRVMNPFDSMFRLVYQLTIRTIGAREIADNPELLNHTLSIFEQFESRTSTLKLFFPWLPTPNHILRMFNGARLYKIFLDIIKSREKSEKPVDDALQQILDTGASISDVISFEIGSLFAGLINTGLHASYLPAHCADNPEWKAKVQAEVDGVIAKYRSTPEQSPAMVLSSLTVEQWESEFPLIDLSLRESIRVGMPGAGLRKNVGPRDIPIGNTGEVIPKGSYAIYLFNDVHKNPDIYTESHKFDPTRYFHDRAEDKKMNHTYLGWGSGRHPCLGMRFAKLEMVLCNAYFFAMFDFEPSGKDGSLRTEPVPPVDVKLLQIRKPDDPIFIRYRPRVY